MDERLDAEGSEEDEVVEKARKWVPPVLVKEFFLVSGECVVSNTCIDHIVFRHSDDD